MSANLTVDIGGTCQFHPSAWTVVPTSPASGTVVGTVVDLKDSDTLCNVFVAGGGSSGTLSVLLQTADAISGLIQSGGLPPSGSFTDPTSGLAQMPTWFQSGGVLLVNSGLYALPNGGGASGGMGVNTFTHGISVVFNSMGHGPFPVSGSAPAFTSGGVAFAAFQRPHRFARLIVQSGAFNSFVMAGFVSQKRTTGSGGGFTFSPTSGTVNV